MKLPGNKWARKFATLILLLGFVGICAFVIFRIVYLNQSTPPTLRGVSKGKRILEESNSTNGLEEYGNDTWGPPIIERSASGIGNTNEVNTHTNQQYGNQ